MIGQSRNKTPIVLLYSNECEIVEKTFTTMATKRGVFHKIVNITSPDVEPKLKPLLQKAMTSVSNLATVTNLVILVLNSDQSSPSSSPEDYVTDKSVLLPTFQG